jgi:ABC-type glycerol-3-phosphate transport system substrate-binding protein
MKLVPRLVMALLLVAGAALLIWGPRPRPKAPPGRVVVTYWEKWTGREADDMRRIVDDFNATVGKDKNIYVEYLSISHVDRKTLTATAAGVPPDVAGLFDAQLAPFAARGALEPLDDLAAEHGLTAADYKPVYWNACHYDGHLYGLVSTPAAVALHYNKTLFRAAGLDPSRPPRTIEELDEYAKVLTTFHDGHLSRAGYLPSEPGWYLMQTPYWFGGQLYDKSANRFVLTSPANLAAFQWVQSYSQQYGQEAVGAFQSGVGQFNTPQNAFLAGTVAMEQQGPWMAAFIADLKPSMSQALVPHALERYLPRILRPYNYDWGVAPFPSAKGAPQNVTYAGFDFLAIPKGSRHKREAFEFIAYVNRQDVMEKLCLTQCKNSPLANVSPDFIRLHPNPDIDVFERLTAGPNARPPLGLPIEPQVQDELKNMAQRIIKMDQSPAAALRAAQARCQEQLDRYEADQARRAKQ